MDDKPTDVACVINKTEKHLNANGDAYIYKNLVVQSKDMKEATKVFDDRWDKEC